MCAGTSDHIVFANSSEKSYEKLSEHDVLCELKLSIGGRHCFQKIHNSIEPGISMRQIQDSIVEFILKNLEK